MANGGWLLVHVTHYIPPMTAGPDAAMTREEPVPNHAATTASEQISAANGSIKKHKKHKEKKGKPCHNSTHLSVCIAVHGTCSVCAGMETCLQVCTFVSYQIVHSICV